MKKKAFLLILDGWGLGTKPEADAIAQANTPFFDGLMEKYPHSTLITHGEDVGLPEGQMGNSEVGHLNIGAGRVVWQELARINKAIRERELHQNDTLLNALQHAKKSGAAVHFIGLVSDGGVHSHIDHLKALCDIAVEQGNERVFIHAITDGRDCDPKSGKNFIKNLQQHIQNTPVRLASVVGRYFAMDRDKRWERVKIAYDLFVHGKGRQVKSIERAISASYQKGVTDEFLPAYRLDLPSGEGVIRPGDTVICFNFRTDRLRELTIVLSQRDFPDFNMAVVPNLHYVTMTKYDDTYQNVNIIFQKDDVSMTMGEALERAGRTQVRIAETEKYPHVTFFFSGGREATFEGERRLMQPSPKVATYDLQPEMSAPAITDAILDDMQKNQPDFICLNFANTDMVGHTGVFAAAMRAAETVDACLAKIIPVALSFDYQCLIIADHGNSDFLINDDGSPNTAHTKNLVPCILVANDLSGKEKLHNGRLADVAPTLLKLMDVPQPDEMTGVALF